LPDLIETQSTFAEALEHLRAADSIALDTESDSFFAYQPRVCLLQASVPGHDFLIDPLADGLDLAPLGELLGDPAREIVLHAAENDVIQLVHQFGWRIARLFDTQVACFVLGLAPYSLAGVLEARFEVKLDKSQQRSDWSRRPLEKAQVEYAAEDTRYLLDLAAELHERAEQSGRVEEIDAECRRIAERDWEPEPFDPESFRRMNGAKGLDGRGLRILKGLYLLRNREAERRNWAPYRIAPDSALVKIARERLRQHKKGIPGGFWRRYGNEVARLVVQTRDQGAPPEPPRQRNRGEPVAPEVKERYEKLRRWRTGAAEERGVESWVVARNELLMRVAALPRHSVEDLNGVLEPFRLREYGAAMIQALLA
jgi:ribonuclease D